MLARQITTIVVTTAAITGCGNMYPHVKLDEAGCDARRGGSHTKLRLASLALAAAVFLVGACQTPVLTLVKQPESVSEKPSIPTIIEPIFEETELENFTHSSTVGRTTTTTLWQDKIWLVKPEQRRRLYNWALPKLGELGFGDTNSLRAGAVSGSVRVVRLTFASYKFLEQDQTAFWGCMASAFTPLCPPLVFGAFVPMFVPVRTKEKIDVVAKVYEAPARELGLIDSPGSDYPFVDLSRATLLAQKRFELPFHSERGLFRGFDDATMAEALKEQFAPAIVHVAREAASLPGSSPAPAATMHTTMLWRKSDRVGF